jgi:arginyl-tRNA synthetase
VACRLHGLQKIEEMKVIARSNRFLALALMLSFTALQNCCTALVVNRIALKTTRKEFRRFCASTLVTDNSKITGRTRELISDGVRSALESAFGSEAPGAEPMVITSKGDFGDYQCNAALPLAKLLGAKPKDVAAKLMSTIQADVDMSKLISSMDISGPGFINIHLSDSYMREKLTTMVKTPERLGMEPVSGASRQRVIVDFSSPNIAKEMHVGHLRSTIIGDSLSRVLEFLGHDVVRLNHVGDWGTQFGMLIRFMQEKQGETREQTQEGASVSIRDDIGLGDLVQFYKAAKKRFDEDPQFEKASREEVVLLQSGDEGSLKAWNSICDLSRAEFSKIYDILEVQINERGESFYNPMLASLVQELESSGKAVQSEGATCIFLPGYSNPDGTPQPMIIKKSDGGFLYATTDLAAIRQRSRDEKADRVLYGESATRHAAAEY